MIHGAMLEQGVTTLVIHFSCTMKLHTIKKQQTKDIENTIAINVFKIDLGD